MSLADGGFGHGISGGMRTNPFAKQARALDLALQLLAEAERRMVWTTDRPRLRMRLLLERSSILAARARQANSPIEAKQKYREAAVFDSQQLTQMVAISATPLWKRLAEYLADEIAALPPQAR